MVGAEYSATPGSASRRRPLIRWVQDLTSDRAQPRGLVGKAEAWDSVDQWEVEIGRIEAEPWQSKHDHLVH